MMSKCYPSKISYALLVFIFLIFFGPLIPIVLSETLNVALLGTVAFLFIVFAFILHLFLKTEYTIESNLLKIKCGLLNYKPIDISKIKEISNTKSLMASPAPSFDRIEIKYGEFSSIIISPKDKHEFAEDLIKINPNINNLITNS